MFTLKIFTPSDTEYFVVHDVLASEDVPVTRNGEWSIASAPARFTLERVARWCDNNNIARGIKIVDDGTCERCKWDKTIPHNNCMYGGRKIGHSVAHCTADACY